ncbi:MAG TPA: hypothetical protein IAB44_00075 [Candidatus Limivivens intestinipullorum]|uniref:DUF6870 domain-containing protein n=1 Tax=Candidatus Limivivens intestinipullorum TaxID=2840858 RepID=A0A9D1EQ67_9FIRM|nr:hypothetical protein [Candidatus Limivivens intestinipullorum]
MEMGEINIADRSVLKDIRDVVIDTSKPCIDRVKTYIEQIGNPYCYLDNGVVVQIGYADTPVSLQDRLVSYASSIDNAVGNL